MLSVQKTVEKTPNIGKNKTIFKIGQLAKALAHAKPIVFAKSSVWSKIKNAKKTC